MVIDVSRAITARVRVFRRLLVQDLEHDFAQAVHRHIVEARTFRHFRRRC